MSKEEMNYIVTDDNLWQDYEKQLFINPCRTDEDREIIKERVKFVENRNKEKKIKPYYDMDYYCDTCGAEDGACDPVSGLCYHCNSDNWAPINYLIGH